LQEKTDKALDAWAALQEKYTSLEKVLLAVNEEKLRQDEYISKLKAHISRVRCLLIATCSSAGIVAQYTLLLCGTVHVMMSSF
jgi:hypothetical protein